MTTRLHYLDGWRYFLPDSPFWDNVILGTARAHVGKSHVYRSRSWVRSVLFLPTGGVLGPFTRSTAGVLRGPYTGQCGVRFSMG